MLYRFSSKRLHNLFESTLLRLPLDVRRRIVDTVATVTDQPSEAAKHHCPTDSAAVTNGHCVYLDAKALGAAPNELVEAAVAHELGHVFLGHMHPDAKGRLTDDHTADQQVDNWVKLWGFRQLVREQQAMSAGVVYRSLTTFGGERL